MIVPNTIYFQNCRQWCPWVLQKNWFGSWEKQTARSHLAGWLGLRYTGVHVERMLCLGSVLAYTGTLSHIWVVNVSDLPSSGFIVLCIGWDIAVYFELADQGYCTYNEIQVNYDWLFTLWGPAMQLPNNYTERLIHTYECLPSAWLVSRQLFLT